ncbi:MAG: hypothetical protein HKN46_05335 [Acidimicrobiia bacterium]|nr:hypothetical protein [Acidimicrobiia bacterium]
MDRLAATIVDQLEALAAKVRAMTVDRARSSLTSFSIGITAVTLALFAAVVLVKGLFRLLAVVTTEAGAYGIFGGIFLIGAAFIWAKRNDTGEDNG